MTKIKLTPRAFKALQEAKERGEKTIRLIRKKVEKVRGRRPGRGNRFV